MKVEAPSLPSFPDRYDRHCISPQSLYSRDPPNRRSLQSEIQDMQQVGNTQEPQFMFSWWWFSVSCRSLGLQQHHRGLDDISLPSLHTHSDDIQSIIHRIKSAEIALLLHNKYPERVSGEGDTQQRIRMACSNVCVYESVLSLRRRTLFL